MELTQTIVVVGIVALPVLAVINYLRKRKSSLVLEKDNLEAITAQVAQYLETPIEETPKAKKKRKYYPRKPKTQA